MRQYVDYLTEKIVFKLPKRKKRRLSKVKIWVFHSDVVNRYSMDLKAGPEGSVSHTEKWWWTTVTGTSCPRKCSRFGSDPRFLYGSLLLRRRQRIRSQSFRALTFLNIRTFVIFSQINTVPVRQNRPPKSLCTSTLDTKKLNSRSRPGGEPKSNMSNEELQRLTKMYIWTPD